MKIFFFKTIIVFFVVLIIAGISSRLLFADTGQVEVKSFAGIEMIKVPPGKNFPPFWIGRYEITQSQYKDIAGINPSRFVRTGEDASLYPVERVSWYRAIEYCNALSIKSGLKTCYLIDKKNCESGNRNQYDSMCWTVTIINGSNGFRLPTSEEWEYAYRAGTTTKYYWGDRDEPSIIDQYAVYEDNSCNGIEHANKNYGIHRVGSKKPNLWGLYDMAGNVWEWCFELYKDPIRTERIIKGGSWGCIEGMGKYFLMADGIYHEDPFAESDFTGFRVVRSM